MHCGFLGIFRAVCYEDIERFGRLYRVWMFNEPQVIIGSAENAEKILQSSQHIAKSQNYRFLHGWMGQGLLTSKGSRYKLIISMPTNKIIHAYFNKITSGKCIENV
jgi:hypothetical protein